MMAMMLYLSHVLARRFLSKYQIRWQETRQTEDDVVAWCSFLAKNPRGEMRWPPFGNRLIAKITPMGGLIAEPHYNASVTGCSVQQHQLEQVHSGDPPACDCRFQPFSILLHFIPAKMSAARPPSWLETHDYQDFQDSQGGTRSPIPNKMSGTAC